jgi:hypothetical protein
MLNFLKKDELAQIEQKTLAITELRKTNTDLEQAVGRLSQELEDIKNTQAKESKKSAEFIGDLEEAKQKQEHDLANAKQTIRDLEVNLENQQTKLEGINKKLEIELTEARQKLEDLEKNILEQQTELNSTASETKLNQAHSQLEQLRQDREQVVKDRQRLWEEYQKLKESRDALQARFNEIEASKSEGHTPQERSELEQALHEERLLIHQMDYEIADHKRENALLQIQIQQAQEELISYQQQIQVTQQENSALNARWKRLERRMPNYIDFGGLEVIQVDAIGAAPQIVWRISNFFQAGLSLPHFYFRTTSNDGLAGIGLVDDLASINTARVLIPESIQTSPDQVELFRSYTSTQWRQINAALSVLEQLIVNKGLGLGEAVEGFDFSFWKQSLSSLITEIRKLPQLLRFGRIKLKREIRNPDYEHLWLEFYDLEFGNQRKPKLEFRLGAAMIQPDSFSRFPKLEFPLVDGVHKPFESWFAESYDDHGGKFELRFSLDKQAFDVQNWLKLSSDDRLLLQNLILALPSSIASLVKDQIAIGRPWAQWVDFARETAQLFRLQLQVITTRMNAQANEPAAAQAPQMQVSDALATAPKQKPISVSVVKRPQTPVKENSAKVVKKPDRDARSRRASKV